MQKYKKHPWLCPSSVINSLEFFLFYCCISSTFLSFLFFFFRPPSLGMPFHVIYHDLYTILTVHMSQASGAFSCPILHLLESSTISCKAVYLLFRHHLHINVTRGLVGKHLMRRQQLLQIFIIPHPHPHPLSNIYPFPCCEIPLICYIKELGMLLATSDRGFEMIILFGYG